MLNLLRRAGETALNTAMIIAFIIGCTAFGLGYLFVFVWIPFSSLFVR